MGIYSVCIAPLRLRLSGNSLLLASLLLAATLTSCANILAQRWALQWQQSLGIYGGLIALQCVVLEYNGFFLSGACPAPDVFLACRARCYWRWPYCVNCSVRGTSAAFCPSTGKALVLFSDGLHLLTLVPGAFILLGLLIAARQAWTRSNALSKETHHP